MAHEAKIDQELIDKLLAGEDPKTVLSSDGLLGELKKALAERMLDAEMDVHLEDPQQQAKGNHRNGAQREDGAHGERVTTAFDSARPPWPL